MPSDPWTMNTNGATDAQRARDDAVANEQRRNAVRAAMADRSLLDPTPAEIEGAASGETPCVRCGFPRNQHGVPGAVGTVGCGAFVAPVSELTPAEIEGAVFRVQRVRAGESLHFVYPDQRTFGSSSRTDAYGRDIDTLLAALAQGREDSTPQPLGDWGEDDGPVLWWVFDPQGRVHEPPFVGTPLDSDWPGYHTHWTRIAFPIGFDARATGEGR